VDPELAAKIQEHIAQMGEANEVTQRRAANDLVEIGLPAVLPLIRVLENNTFSARSRVAWVLGEIGDERAILPLCDTLQDADGNLVKASLEAMELLVRPSSVAAVEPLTAALADARVDVRLATVKLLGRIEHPDVAPALRTVLKDADENVRFYAAKALARRGETQAVPLMLKGLKHESWRIRKESAVVLGETHEKSAAIPLCEVLRDPDGEVRHQAIVALGRIGDAAAVPFLVHRLKDEYVVNRREAASALADIGDAEAVPALVDALKGADEKQSAHIVQALKALTKEDPGADYAAWKAWLDADE
jgi:HEAT repeat protein